jgi:CheY-like chemotaxis protein
MHSILFVDDDAATRKLVCCVLERRGFLVHAVPTAEVALVLLKEDIHFDLLMTDVIMPGGMDGFELADRATLLQPNLRVLYLTGFVNLPRRRLAQLRGRLVTKPIMPTQLEDEICTLLAQPVRQQARFSQFSAA